MSKSFIIGVVIIIIMIIVVILMGCDNPNKKTSGNPTFSRREIDPTSSEFKELIDMAPKWLDPDPDDFPY